jgi:hypothetical protein
MNYRRCNACGLSNLATESFCFRCGAALGSDTRAQAAPTVFATDPIPAVETRPIAPTNCPSCGGRITMLGANCQYCGGDLAPAKSADFYQARLVPDSGFRRAQHQPAEDDDPGIRNSKVTVFAVFNLVFALLALGGIGFWMLVAFTSVFQGDPKVGDIVVGSTMFIVPNVVYFLLFLPAAIGLMRRKSWGYYFHLTAAIFAAFSCVGLLYTVPALIFAFQPDFKSDFPGRR